MSERKYSVISFVFTTIIYLAIYLLLKRLAALIPDMSIWNTGDPLFTFWSLNFTLIDLIWALYGSIVFNHASFRLSGITAENHKARNDATRQPKHLVTDGYYAEVRHPMYGVFVMTNAALFLPLRSLAGVIFVLLVLAVQTGNAVIEEKTALLKLFPEEYPTYMEKVPGRLFPRIFRIYLYLGLGLSFIGFFIR